MSPGRRGSLVVVGTGIKFAAHTTPEALAAIEHAERLFYLVTDPVAEEWIRRLNPTATTLEDCYAEGKPRTKTYRDMTRRIVSAVRDGFRVCAAFYGHPGVFADTPHDAIRRARREGFPARMLPGVSAEDCLFADLGVDPGVNGCQSFEATDFLAYRRKFDPSSALILWQVGVLGEPSIRKEASCRPERLRVLTDVLRRYYPPRHRVTLYEAAPYTICDPRVVRMPLATLPRATVFTMATLYVPPKPSRGGDAKILRWFRQA